MGVHLATAALATIAAAVPAPAHSAHAHLPLSPHIAAASSFSSPPPRRAEGRHRRVAHAAADPPVTIADFHFTASTTTVHLGDTVTWTNDGPSPHTATASDGSFDTGTLRKGQSASHTFTHAGTFAYICKIHPFMHAMIVVLAAATTAPGTTTTTAPATSTTPSETTPAATATTATTATTAAATTAATTTAATAPSRPTLPVTGTDVLSAIAAGGILVAAGLALRAAVRT